MALQKTMEYKGLSILDGYNKINCSAVFKVGVIYNVIIDVEVSLSKGQPMIDVRKYVFEYDLSGSNVLIQGYDYLKTLSAYTGAIDV